ncbi:DeoR/GlpR family DNA-binding transcription regulator [Paenibacillus sp. NPDC058071]|uniref:DeoR/GlpR family DNA-binding transcription regulator n=1 Tax=Paenibacillus sp. NPDC058071 TaxID=3346326 RepID=UPI0036DF4867
MSELNNRQQLILERIEAEGEIKINELKLVLDVTEMTIRRDLEKLEQAGLIRRTFGGAIPIVKDVAIKERLRIHVEEKVLIGREAAALIVPGDSVFIDGGTTTLEIARAMKPGLKATVVTNALNVAIELLDKKIPTIVVGGNALETTASLVGPLAAEAIGSLSFTRVFLGATGLSAIHGFSNSNAYEAEIKKLAIAKAGEVNIVMDHSKFGAMELFSFAALPQVDRIITDKLPDEQLLSACREAEVKIVKAST